MCLFARLLPPGAWQLGRAWRSVFTERLAGSHHLLLCWDFTMGGRGSAPITGGLGSLGGENLPLSPGRNSEAQTFLRGQGFVHAGIGFSQYRPRRTLLASIRNSRGNSRRSLPRGLSLTSAAGSGLSPGLGTVWGHRDEEWWGRTTEGPTIYEGNGVVLSIKD